MNHIILSIRQSRGIPYTYPKTQAKQQQLQQLRLAVALSPTWTSIFKAVPSGELTDYIELPEWNIL